ncbi:hypothetical protein KSP39_PZI017483 [Platanthera zijinensis]|uniref:Uncharacterized protein n=1 Tax=Platanthera zijinensis TaxID=2320716 RepID=A0AAP0G010_9ASPA
MEVAGWPGKCLGIISKFGQSWPSAGGRRRSSNRRILHQELKGKGDICINVVHVCITPGKGVDILLEALHDLLFVLLRQLFANLDSFGPLSHCFHFHFLHFFYHFQFVHRDFLSGPQSFGSITGLLLASSAPLTASAPRGANFFGNILRSSEHPSPGDSFVQRLFCLATPSSVDSFVCQLLRLSTTSSVDSFVCRLFPLETPSSGDSFVWRLFRPVALRSRGKVNLPLRDVSSPAASKLSRSLVASPSFFAVSPAHAEPATLKKQELIWAEKGASTRDEEKPERSGSKPKGKGEGTPESETRSFVHASTASFKSDHGVALQGRKKV